MSAVPLLSLVKPLAQADTRLVKQLLHVYVASVAAFATATQGTAAYWLTVQPEHPHGFPMLLKCPASAVQHFARSTKVHGESLQFIDAAALFAWEFVGQVYVLHVAPASTAAQVRSLVLEGLTIST
jgi:hypothetical protein